MKKTLFVKKTKKAVIVREVVVRGEHTAITGRMGMVVLTDLAKAKFKEGEETPFELTDRNVVNKDGVALSGLYWAY